jgi:hypothetical protein
MDPQIRFPDGSEQRLSAIVMSTETRIQHLARVHMDRHPVFCCCRSEPIPMGIACRREPTTTYYLYHLHRTDPERHAYTCPHHLEAVRTDPEDWEDRPGIEVAKGRVVVHLAAPTSLRPEAKSEADEDPAPRGTTKRATVPREKVPLARLLTLLWEEAELNVWRTAFAGRRSYGVVRNRLIEAASQIYVGRHPLQDLLFVPPPYTAQRQDVAQQEYAEWLERLRPGPDGKGEVGFLVGILRKTEATDRGAIINLAHHAQPSYLSAPQWGVYAMALTVATAEDAAPCAILATVERRDGRNGPWLSLQDLALLPLAGRDSWVPVMSVAERTLLEKLLAEHRAFRKPLRQGQAPNFILEDRADRAQLWIRPAHAQDGQWLPATQDKDQATWVWNEALGRVPPDLPPPEL